MLESTARISFSLPTQKDIGKKLWPLLYISEMHHAISSMQATVSHQDAISQDATSYQDMIPDQDSELTGVPIITDICSHSLIHKSSKL